MSHCQKIKMSKLSAKLMLSGMQHKDKGAKRIYYCAGCRAWHITSKEKKS